MKKILISILSAAALVACSKGEDVNKGTDGTKTVVVNMSTLTKTLGRAPIDESASLAGTYAKVEDCIVYFLNANGDVVKQVNDGAVLADNAAFEFSTDNLNGADHKGAAVFTVETSAEKVYVLCNVARAGLTVDEVKALASLTEIKAKTYELNTQHDNIEYPLLDGEDAIVVGAGNLNGTEYGYTAEVTVKPQVMRLEIHSIKAENIAGGAQPQAGDIASFSVAGIYVEEYHPTSSIGGQTSGDKYVIGTDKDLDAYTGYSIVPATAASVDNNVAPAAGMVWGYTLFPENVKVIVELTDVVRYINETETEPVENAQFITVTGFKTAAVGGANVDFVGGNVYKVGAIVFNGEDITDVPNQTDKSVMVTVSVAPWNEQEIYPEVQ